MQQSSFGDDELQLLQVAIKHAIFLRKPGPVGQVFLVLLEVLDLILGHFGHLPDGDHVVLEAVLLEFQLPLQQSSRLLVSAPVQTII